MRVAALNGRRLLQPVPVRHRAPADIVLRRLSQSANKGRLWLAVAAAGALLKGRPRRAAIRGMGSLAATSVIVNVAVKPLIRRQRPDIELTPLVRRLRRQPWTTSFPSGHAASAAAFTAGALLEHRVAGAALAPVATAVGYSRVHVGVHHTSDVVIGAALGAGVALATQWWWPVRPDRPARTREPAAAPSLPEGRGLVVITNDAAGFGDANAGRIRRLLPGAEIVSLAPGGDVRAELDRRARSVRAIGAAGGDGTVAAAAAVALEHGVPLAVFPAGTANHFAHDLGIETYADTARAVEDGDAVLVDVATAGGDPFVNAASIGGYPEIVHRREELAPYVGKWLAMAMATGAVLRSQRPLRLALDGRPVEVWGLFVGNGAYSRRGAFPSWRERLDDGHLDVQYLPVRPLARTRAVLAALTGMTEHNGTYRTRTARPLRVESLDGPVELARDGEVAHAGTTVEFRKLPRNLVAYCPRRAADSRQGYS